MSDVAKRYQNDKDLPPDAEAVARPDLTAETHRATNPALPADVTEATKWLSGQIEQGWVDITESHDREEWAHLSALLAHLTRQEG